MTSFVSCMGSTVVECLACLHHSCEVWRLNLVPFTFPENMHRLYIVHRCVNVSVNRLYVPWDCLATCPRCTPKSSSTHLPPKWGESAQNMDGWMDEWMAGRMNTYLLLEAFQGQHIGGDHVCLTVKRFCMDLSVSRVKFGCACMRISTCSHPPPPHPKCMLA